MPEQKFKTYKCNRPVKRYGKTHVETVDIEADAVRDINHLLDIGAISELAAEDKAEAGDSVGTEDLTSAVQRMIDKDPNKENAGWWVESNGKPECGALADEAGVKKVSGKQRDAAVAALAS